MFTLRKNVLLEDLIQDRGRGLPVMVWIHGGSLTSGAGSIYDPSQLVKKGVIVVTINYRLGLWVSLPNRNRCRRP